MQTKCRAGMGTEKAKGCTLKVSSSKPRPLGMTWATLGTSSASSLTSAKAQQSKKWTSQPLNPQLKSWMKMLIEKVLQVSLKSFQWAKEGWTGCLWFKVACCSHQLSMKGKRTLGWILQRLPTGWSTRSLLRRARSCCSSSRSQKCSRACTRTRFTRATAWERWRKTLILRLESCLLRSRYPKNCRPWHNLIRCQDSRRICRISSSWALPSEGAATIPSHPTRKRNNCSGTIQS